MIFLVFMHVEKYLVGTAFRGPSLMYLSHDFSTVLSKNDVRLIGLNAFASV